MLITTNECCKAYIEQQERAWARYASSPRAQGFSHQLMGASQHYCHFHSTRETETEVAHTKLHS